ncbi:antitoxin VapB family protein [Halococcus agarilyticus]|uniref:antitoxin VapB family protein n=1 Tax=Halococcus agarilyticus TaxID=1232219 RepID=UPI0006781A3F|nr:antitoxin VapB family protein [Halococcus agarilyticus]
MSKSVRLDEDVYEFVRARKRDDETFSEVIERLVGGPSLLELVGILTDEEASAFEEAIRESHDAHDREIERFLDGVE